MKKLALLALFIACASGAFADPAAPPSAPGSLGPQELVANSAKRMLQELDANRAAYANDPAKLDSLVADVLLPNFDTEYAARLVLGQTWRTATPEHFSLHKVAGSWKAWDVVIEGISYVKSFKTDLGAEIQQKGLDEVINRLQTNGKPAPGGAAGSH
jgi:ABC-type transporter MlaC component